MITHKSHLVAYHAIMMPLSVHSLGGGHSKVHCVAFATISSALRIYKLLATPPDTTWKNREAEYQMLSRTDRKRAVNYTWGGNQLYPARNYLGLSNEYLHNKNLEILITASNQHVFTASTLNIFLVSESVSATFANTIHQYFRLHLYFWFLSLSYPALTKPLSLISIFNVPSCEPANLDSSIFKDLRSIK